ncbi:HAD-IIA family hydrolase [Actinoallomurus iriomotensis]|uniref:Haloacid dehalogenase n=1 Tax=Actinoallomurus iriomotensis TaxID=478107 RepID=A0A9W6RU02_9ACTN|nr:HAD-IIA family hydrolase [Actinoallomurus iriomotensis]GLY81720.1 haloacid dehalogenase [Actinoallomurus iriomotensis]
MRGIDRPPAEAYDVGVLDLDGVVYIGHDPVPGAAGALEKARASGMRLAFATNNASRTPSATAALLGDVGVPAAAEDVVTSAQAAARLLSERLPAGSKVLVVGGMGLRQALREAGLRPVSTAAEEPAAVAQGYSPGLSYDLLAEGAQAVAAGAIFVASNGDTTIPGKGGRLRPGNGALVQVIRTATGVDPIVTGKPERPLHRETILRTGAERPLIVGDRLDTDIEGAHNGGADSLLVFTGVTDPRALLAAPPRHRPTYVSADLNGLLVPHNGVRREGAAYVYGGWTVSGDLEVSGDGDPMDGLRALCAAVWDSGDLERGERALDRLF